MADLNELLLLADRADKAGNAQEARELYAEYERQTRVRTSGPTAAVAPARAEGAGGGGSYSARPLRSLVQGATQNPVSQVGAEAGKQLFELATLPVEAVRAGANKLAGDPVEFGRGTRMVTDAVDTVIPPPKGELGKAATRVAGSGVAALAFPGAPLRNFFTGVAAATGGELGDQTGRAVAGPSASPGQQDLAGGVGRLAGALLGGAPWTVARGKGTKNQMVQDSAKGLTQGDFAAAQRLQEAARAQGIYLSPEQLFGTNSGLDELFRETISANAGKGQLQSAVMGQVGKAEELARATAGKMGGNVGAEQATRDLRLGAERGLENAGRLTGAQRALYGKGQAEVPPQMLSSLQADLGTLADEFKASEVASRIQRVQKVIDSVTEKVRLETPNGPKAVAAGKGAAKWKMAPQPPTVTEVPLGATAADLDIIVKEAEGALADLTLSSPAMQKLQTGRAGEAFKRIRSVLDELNPQRTAANEMYKAAQEGREALSSSLMGRLAGRRGVNEEVPDNLGMLSSTLLSDRDNSKGIAQLAGALRGNAAKGHAESAQALPQAMRVLWDEAANKAFAPTQGRIPATAGATFAETLIGSPAREANFRQLAQGVAATFGEDPKAYAQGLVDVLKVVQATGRNRTGLGFAAADLKHAAGTSAVRDAFRLTQPIAQTHVISERLRNLAYQRQYRQLEDLFLQPDVVQQISNIGAMPIVSSRRGALITSLLTSLGVIPDQEMKE